MHTFLTFTFFSRGSSSRRIGNDREGERTSERDRDRDNFSKWRDRQYCGPRRWLESALKDSWDKDSGKRLKLSNIDFQYLRILRNDAIIFIARLKNSIDNKKKELAAQSPLWISEELEWWHERSSDLAPRFVQIASLYSELIAVSAGGQLYQWKWSESEPYKHPEVIESINIVSNILYEQSDKLKRNSLQNPNIHHPKAPWLAVTTEKIVNISATAIRCSISTESGKVATWLDELVGHVASRLEHPAQTFTEFTLDKIVSLHTCALYTVAKLESGDRKSVV